MESPNLINSLCGFPPLQHRALLNTFTESGQANTFSAITVGLAEGTQGIINLLPATAAKGKVTFTTADNTGDTTTAVTFAAQAAARTYTVPDAGGSTSFVMAAGAQTIAGQKTFSTTPIGTQICPTIALADLTALAGAVKAVWVAPFAGTITSGFAVVNAAFTTSDIVATMRINTTNVTSGACTITQAGSAALSKGTCTPSAANVVAAGDVVNFTITGGAGGPIGGALGIVVTRTA